MKKNLLYLAMAALLTTACTDDTDKPVNENSRVVGFKSYVEKPTKGTSVASGELKQDFTAYAYYSIPGDEPATELAPDFMFNQHIVYSNPGFTYTPVKYWPATGDVNFYAYTPYNSPNLVVTNPKLVTDKGYPAFTYSVATVVAQEEDLLVATLEDQDGLSGSVNFDFDHALCKVGFSARTAGDYTTQGVTVKVKSITLTDIHDKGAFSYDHYTNSADTTLWWTANTATKVSYVPGIVNSGGVTVSFHTNNTYGQLNANDQFLLMIPQDFTGSTSKLTLAYEISYNDGTTATQQFTKDVPLNGTIRWTAGVYVNYAFTISLNMVTFTANVSDWRNKQENIIILPSEDE